MGCFDWVDVSCDVLWWLWEALHVWNVTFQGEDPSMGNPNFWDELFLLKVCTADADIAVLL